MCCSTVVLHNFFLHRIAILDPTKLTYLTLFLKSPYHFIQTYIFHCIIVPCLDKKMYNNANPNIMVYVSNKAIKACGLPALSADISAYLLIRWMNGSAADKQS